MHDISGGFAGCATGWTGKVLRVDLSAATTETIRLPRQTYADWIGGRGLAGWLLRPHAALQPDHPDMPVIFMTGPLTGTAAPTSGRGTLMSRSPLTGAVGDSSFGGGLATRLKRAGWDGVVITGRSAALVGIEIKGGKAHVVSAEALRGAGTAKVFDGVGCDAQTSVACIGPAGENGSLLACVAVDRHHAAARTGLGASLGIKNLKYLSVTADDAPVPVADADALDSARQDIVRLTMASPALMGCQGFTSYGTAAMYDLMDARRMMPTDNFRRTRYDEAGQLNAHAFKVRYAPEQYGCEGCHIRCKRLRRAGGTVSAMPQFEAMSHLTALIGNTDMELVMEASSLLADLGLDPVGAGGTLACRMEVEGCGPLGQSEVLGWVREMAEGAQGSYDERLGLGAGSLRWARERGAVKSAMTVKGLELGAYDPRGAYGLALAYAVNTRGGCHQRAYPISSEILRKPVATDRFTFSGKARMVKTGEDVLAALGALTACSFIGLAAGLEEYARAYSAVTGIRATAQDLLRVGERICCNERVMNGLNGLGAAADDLPERFFTEEGSSGEGVRIAPLDRDEFLEARARYYRIRGLDEGGVPLRGRAEELGVSW